MVLHFVILFHQQTKAQNLLNLDDLITGTGGTTQFDQVGSTSENERVWGIGPQGQRAILWEATPADPGGAGDGGWASQYIPIDHNKIYRVSTWVKKTNSDDGTTTFRVFGGTSPLSTLDGVTSGNKNVWYGDLPVLDRWYLLVGYIHGSGDTSQEHCGGLYDATTGKKLMSTTDYKFQPNTTSLKVSTFLFYSLTSQDRQYHYAPRIDEVNGNEPSLSELLGIPTTYSVGQENLLNLRAWTPGPGNTDDFTQFGTTPENERVWGMSPYGQRAILWESRPDGHNNSDGGFKTSDVQIDHRRTYRYSVWLKKTNSTLGTTHFGPQQDLIKPLNKLDGTNDTNPYFWFGQLPQLDHWYLLVAYVHGSTDNTTQHYGRIYNGTTGTEEMTITDFKFNGNHTITRLRAFLSGDTNTSGRQHAYAPRIDEVNGFEPSIFELLSTPPGVTESLSVGTNNLPDGFKLSVGGQAIVERIKVQLEESWPDYVFQEDYDLKSLNELRDYIRKNGHLPGIPSAGIIKKSHQDLGLIQLKLLEKIEELSLYAIQADSINAKLSEENATFRNALNQLIKKVEHLEKRMDRGKR